MRSLITLALVFAVALPLAADDWSKAQNAFKRAIKGTNEDHLDLALKLVVKDNSGRAAKLLISGMRTPNDRFYWRIVTAMSSLGSREAVDTIIEEILKDKKGIIRRDLMMSLQLNRGPLVEDALLQILKEGYPDVKLIAADELVKRSSKKAIPALIELVKENEKENNEVLRQAVKGLRALTEKDFGASASAWQAWWDKSKDTFKIGKTEAGKSGETVAETLKRNRTTDYEDLKKGAKHEIVIVSGVFDRVQEVLDKMKIPHTVITKDQFSSFDISKTSTLLINCDDFNQKRYDKKALAKIRTFVGRGGYLFTSDWGVVDVLEDAFPGYVKKGGEIPPEMTVDIFPKKGSTGHPFLKEVFVKVDTEDGGEGKSSTQRETKLEFQWLIDPVSYTIEYDPKRVVVLVEAPELRDSYKHTAVAVTFVFGASGKDERGSVATGGTYEELPKMRGGKVLHILSHFHKQKTKDDEYAIQNMLLNFLIESKDRKLLRELAKKRRKK